MLIVYVTTAPRLITTVEACRKSCENSKKLHREMAGEKSFVKSHHSLHSKLCLLQSICRYVCFHRTRRGPLLGCVSEAASRPWQRLTMDKPRIAKGVSYAPLVNQISSFRPGIQDQALQTAQGCPSSRFGGTIVAARHHSSRLVCEPKSRT